MRFAANLADTFAGKGSFGYDPQDEGALATSASFQGIIGVGVDGQGSVYLTDHGNFAIRKIYSDGAVSRIRTIHRTDGSAYPWGIAVDREGNVFYSEFPLSGNYGRVIKVSVDGAVTGYAGGGSAPDCVCRDAKPDGTLYNATEIKLQSPYGLDLDDYGNLFVAELGCSKIRKVSTDGKIQTVAGKGRWNRGYDGDGRPAVDSLLNYPWGLAVGSEGQLFIADTSNHRVRKVDRSGIITTVAGTGDAGSTGEGIPAVEARLNFPYEVDLDSAGNVYLADNGNHTIRVLATDGTIHTVIGKAGQIHPPQVGNPLPDDGGPAENALLANPTDVVVTPTGALLIADNWSERIRRVRMWAGGVVSGGAVLTGDDDSRLTINSDGSYARLSTDGIVTTFGTTGQITSRTYPDTSPKTYSYLPDGRLESIAVPERGSWTFGQASSSMTVTSPEGEATTIGYRDGDLVSIDGGLGGPSASYGYTNHLLTTKTDAGGTTTYVYDPFGRLDVVVQPDGTQTDVNPSELLGIANALPPGVGSSAGSPAPLTSASGEPCCARILSETIERRPPNFPGVGNDKLALGYDIWKVKYEIPPKTFQIDQANLEIYYPNADGTNTTVWSQSVIWSRPGTYESIWEGQWNGQGNPPNQYVDPTRSPYKGRIYMYYQGVVVCGSNVVEVGVEAKALVATSVTGYGSHIGAIEQRAGTLGYTTRGASPTLSKSSLGRAASRRLLWYSYTHGGTCPDGSGFCAIEASDGFIYPSDLPNNLYYSLVFLNGCYSAQAPGAGQFRSKFGARTYVGWKGTISELAAANFATNFFGFLDGERTILAAKDAALSELPTGQQAEVNENIDIQGELALKVDLTRSGGQSQ